MPEAPEAVHLITRALEKAGHPTWVVGGAVRDAHLGVEHDDWDLATQARPGQVRKLFPRTVPIGIEHGTVGVLPGDGVMYEVTTFRRDVETFGRRAVVEFSDRIEDDLARRDFTMNAMAWHPLRGEFLDPFGGLEDLAESRLRTVGVAEERFGEDYLRVLRALRFAGRYSLRIDPPTWDALCAATAHLNGLSAERIREELMKVLSLDPAPSTSLELFAESGALSAVLPELAERRVSDSVGWVRALAWTQMVSRHRPLLRLVALLAGLEDDAVAAILIRLRFSNAATRWVAGMVQILGTPHPRAEPEALRRWLSDAGPSALPDWIRLQIGAARAEAAAEGVPVPVDGIVSLWRSLRREARSGAPLTVDALAMDGRDLIRLGLRPGPSFGRILEDLLDRVLSDPSLNTAETLERLVLELPAPSTPDLRPGTNDD